MTDKTNPDQFHRQEAPIDGSLFGSTPVPVSDQAGGGLHPAARLDGRAIDGRAIDGRAIDGRAIEEATLIGEAKMTEGRGGVSRGAAGRTTSPTGSGTEREGSVAHRRPRGVSFEHYYTTDGVNPFDAIEWTLRTAVIANDKGEVLFRQDNCEIPREWTQMATNVVVSKYFRGGLGTPGREHSVRQLVGRVADTIADWGLKDGTFASAQDGEIFRAELTHMLVNQLVSFNSPVWFNVGVEKTPQCSACFINSVKDSMASILDLAKTEGLLFKYGSGTGSNLSALRSSREMLSAGGQASGPVSFMRGFDAFAGVIKSGGKTRRAAKMVILNAEHPDIEEFIDCKVNEEKKAWALMDAGYDGSFGGEAYNSIFFQNSNNSVRATNEFMRAVEEDGDWTLRAITDGRPMGIVKARHLMRKIAEGTHLCGDPGMQFDTTINEWHTCRNTDRIKASNPCSEYMFLDDSACNLASLNLMKFRDEDGEFDTGSFRHAVRVMITAMEIIVGNSSYPRQAIADNSHRFRPLGLGYANLGALLMNRGLPYDGDAGRDYAAAITALMCGQAYLTSAELARELGPFDGYSENREPMLEVIRMHRAAVNGINANRVPERLLDEAEKVWRDAYALGHDYGYRNSQVTVLAPTGTIGFMMDCDTTGVEPDIALVKYKKLVDGGMMKIINNSVPEALEKLGYDEDSRRGDHRVHRRARDHRRRARPEGRAPAGVRLRLPAGQRPPFDPLHGTPAHDGGRAAVPVRRHQQDGQPAAGSHRRRDHDHLPRSLEDGPQGGGHLPRRQQTAAAAQHRKEARGSGGRTAAGPAQAAAGASAGRAPCHHPQVRDRRARRLHHRGPVPERQAGRDVHLDGEGRLGGQRTDGQLRHQRVDHAAVRRAAEGADQQVHPRALRAERVHQQPGDPDRQVGHGLHLPLDGPEVRRARRRRRRHRSVGARRGARGRRVPEGHGGGRRRAVADHDAAAPVDPGADRQSAVPELRFADHPQRLLLQMHQLRVDNRLLLSGPGARPPPKGGGSWRRSDSRHG